MGYAFQAYAVNEHRIYDFWKSGREEVVAEALATPLGIFRLESMPEVADALRDIATGTVPLGDQPDGARHLYATELLCALWGVKAGPELRIAPRGIEAASELKAFFASAPATYGIRVPDFPVMCGWGAKQVERRLASTQKWPVKLAAERELYTTWLRCAAERKVALVAFYY